MALFTHCPFLQRLSICDSDVGIASLVEALSCCRPLRLLELRVWNKRYLERAVIHQLKVEGRKKKYQNIAQKQKKIKNGTTLWGEEVGGGVGGWPFYFFFF